MMLELLFWLIVGAVLHSYLVFPLVLQLFAATKKQNELTYSSTDELPHIAIILAVYNEELVIEQKLQSTFTTNYPLDKLTFLIGSDASTDTTNAIITDWQQRYPQIKFSQFSARTGKAGIVTQLINEAEAKIFILTDANVFFTTTTLFELVKHFKNPAIAQVGANILNPQHKKEGISFQEKSYLSRENLMKYQEGIIWGSMIGAFGGCYAIRKSYCTTVPATYLMEDFFISMYALSKGGKAINELQAVCYEDVSNKISEEFRRKVRISSGNFQNLHHYRSLLWRFNGLSFCFWSHKVLRWYGPFFILSALFLSGILALVSNFYAALLLVQILLLAIPLLDVVLRSMGVHNKLFRFITHFYLMNLALLIGWVKYARGIKASIWVPTQRNQ